MAFLHLVVSVPFLSPEEFFRPCRSVFFSLFFSNLCALENNLNCLWFQFSKSRNAAPLLAFCNSAAFVVIFSFPRKIEYFILFQCVNFLSRSFFRSSDWKKLKNLSQISVAEYLQLPSSGAGWRIGLKNFKTEIIFWSKNRRRVRCSAVYVVGWITSWGFCASGAVCPGDLFCG